MKRIFVHSIFGIGILLFILIIPGSAISKTNGGALIFILDASGSMWGQVEGKAKMQLAKEVLTDLIMDLPENINVGLVVYGHRKKGDCQDVEELVPIGELDKEKFIQKIKSINPKGKTPITLSVQTTVERLKVTNEDATIILVSDGKETCSGDPCASVRELKESGIKFIMYVIGFDVTEEETEQLDCIAQAGGGAYYEARNAGDLKAAAENVVQKTGRWGFFKIAALKNGKPYKPWLELSHAGEKKSFWNGYVESEKGEPGERIVKLQPGTYDVRVIDNKIPNKPVIHFNDIKIIEGQTVQEKADFTGGSLKVTTLMNGKPIDAEVSLFKPDGKKYYTHWTSNGVRKFDLLQGTYDVKITNHKVAPALPVETFPGVEIAAGQIVEKSVNFSVGFLKVSADKNGKPFNTPVELYTSDGKKYYTHWTSNGVRTFNLVSGKYSVKVLDIDEKGIFQTFPDIQIEDGKTQSIEVSF